MPNDQSLCSVEETGCSAKKKDSSLAALLRNDSIVRQKKGNEGRRRRPSFPPYHSNNLVRCHSERSEESVVFTPYGYEIFTGLSTLVLSRAMSITSIMVSTK
jgi:hypothetical protein